MLTNPRHIFITAIMAVMAMATATAAVPDSTVCEHSQLNVSLGIATATNGLDKRPVSLGTSCTSMFSYLDYTLFFTRRIGFTASMATYGFGDYSFDHPADALTMTDTDIKNALLATGSLAIGPTLRWRFGRWTLQPTLALGFTMMSCIDGRYYIKAEGSNNMALLTIHVSDRKVLPALRPQLKVLFGLSRRVYLTAQACYNANFGRVATSMTYTDAYSGATLHSTSRRCRMPDYFAMSVGVALTFGNLNTH